jgi:ribosomal protein S18 acetylase RimI-like enzyme
MILTLVELLLLSIYSLHCSIVSQRDESGKKEMQMEIREAKENDASEIARLYAQSAAYLRTLGDETDFKFNAAVYLRDGFGENRAFWGLVAEEAGKLWGYLLYHFIYDTDRALRILYILDLLVDEAGRGKGIGTALMQAAETIARQKHIVELQWAVYAPNQAAVNFYRKLGGELIEDILQMKKDVS